MPRRGIRGIMFVYCSMETLTGIGCNLEALPGEMWKEVTGTERAYFVSNMGRLLCRNWKGSGRDAFMKPAKDHRGYVRTMLKYPHGFKTVKVHRVVAQEWIPNPYNKPQVDHINYLRNDNRASNLQWATSKENTERSYADGRISKPVGMSKVTEDDVRAIRSMFKDSGMKRREIADIYGISSATVKDIILRSWRHVQ